MRRVFAKGELGGFSNGSKYATGLFIIGLWFLYVAVCWTNSELYWATPDPAAR